MNYDFSDLTVVKRSGQRVIFNGAKIAVAVKASFDSVESNYTENDINKVYNEVLSYIAKTYQDRKTINVEDIQDIIEDCLKKKYKDIYEAFNCYRLRRAASREVFSEKQQHKFVKTIEKLGLQSNSNLNSTPMDIMHDFGITVSKEFAKAYLIENKYVRLHEEGIIRIHELPYYPLCTTSMSHLNFKTISSNSVDDYLDTIYKIVYEIKKEQTKEQTISNLDQILLPIAVKSLKYIFKRNIINYLNINGLVEYMNIKQILNILDKINSLEIDISIFDNYIFNDTVKEIFSRALKDSKKELEMVIYNSLKNMLIDLNRIDVKMNNNVVSISIASVENFISKIYLNILIDLDCLENVFTVFKLKSSKQVNDLLLEAISLSRNILISFDTDDKCERFSTGEKVFENINDDVDSSEGRILLSTTSINLSRIAMINKDKQIDEFFKQLSDVLDLTKNQLIQRYELQANKYKKNFPNLFKYNVLMDCEKLEETQKIRKILRNGTLNIGIAGYSECISILEGKVKYLDVINFIKDKVSRYSIDNKLNFIISETTDREILKEMFAIDKSIFGPNVFENNKCVYSIISYDESNFNSIDKNIIELQKKLDMRLDVFLKKNSSQKKILDVINKLYEKNIYFFKIRIGKDAN